jgi:hypothetical protein
MLGAQQSGGPPPAPSRIGVALAAPWVDRRGGPIGSGHILAGDAVAGTAPPHERTLFQLFDRVLIAPPVGAVAPERQLYLSYILGPLLEKSGRVVIPTGVLEVVRAPRKGAGAVARIVQMFAEVEQDQAIMALDTAALRIFGQAMPFSGGAVGQVVWINGQVLPTIGQYVVVSLSAKNGVAAGDQVELYRPPEQLRPGSPATSEVSIGAGQVVRVTPFAATIVVTSLEQPKIDIGTAVRISAKMP